MAFIVKKKVSSGEYYYLRKSQRVDGKVKAVTVAYLGKDKREAEKKAEEIMKNQNNKLINKRNKKKLW